MAITDHEDPATGSSAMLDRGARSQEPGQAPAPDFESLAADSSVQFFDLAISEDIAASVASRFFECHDDQADGDGVALHQVTLDDNGTFYHPLTNRIENPDRTYLVDGRKALTAFAGGWLPVPYMRVLTDAGAAPGALDEGPSNWARIFVAHGETPGSFRLVLAIDTALGAGGEQAAKAPTVADRDGGTVFRFSSDVGDIGWFVTEPWVDEWLSEAFRENRRPETAAGGEPQRPDGGPSGTLEHLSHYLALLAVCSASGALPRIQFLVGAPTDSRPGNDNKAFAKPIPVDLVLDIGASRTCAMLSEHLAAGGRTPDAADTEGPAISYLPLRDLNQPWLVHTGLFSSRIEFSRAVLGKEVYSRWSGRSSAFYWPSLARVGAEALRLASEQYAADAFTGLSSPIRYVWDERPSRHVWRFSSAGNSGIAAGGGTRRNPLISGPLLAHLSETGDVLEAGDKRVGTTKPRFARSALLTFFAAELILQAIGAINAPAYRARRGHSQTRRQLARVIVTLPAMMHEAEAAIVRRRVEDAIRLVGLALGWPMEPDATRKAGRHEVEPPKVVIVGAGATGSQIAFLNNEIVHKFRGRARPYFDLIGKARHGYGTSRSVRIATLDIGGGTTSLAVNTYVLDDAASITGTVHLQEGFRIGGDDVAKCLIESFVLPAIERRLLDCKLPEARPFLQGIVTGATHGRASRLGEFRRRFAGELALPAALAMLNSHVAARSSLDDQPVDKSLGELLADSKLDPRAAADELESLASDEGADGFLPLETRISFTLRDVATTSRRVLAPVLASAVHAVRALDCDIVLLSGWMSRMPVIRDALLEGMPIRPDRILAMHDYRMSPWYPREPARGAGLHALAASPASASAVSVGDPKSLPAVGAILLSAPVPRIGTFPLVFKGQEFAVRPCYIGRVGPEGFIAAGDVLFDTRQEGTGGAASSHLLQATFSVVPPVVIGIRHAPLESWPALPICVLALEDMPAEAQPRTPLRVILEWDMKQQAGLQIPKIVRATDVDGIDLASDEITLRLQTLGILGGVQSGHWLDTGVLAIA